MKATYICGERFRIWGKLNTNFMKIVKLNQSYAYYAMAYLKLL
jgi:hypothetical protein